MVGALVEDGLNTLYAFVLLLSLVVAGGNLLALVSRRPRRRAALVLGGSVVAFIVSVSLFIPDKPPEMAFHTAGRNSRAAGPSARYSYARSACEGRTAAELNSRLARDCKGLP